jgi:hypothetical protein
LVGNVVQISSMHSLGMLSRMALIKASTKVD